MEEDNGTRTDRSCPGTGTLGRCGVLGLSFLGSHKGNDSHKEGEQPHDERTGNHHHQRVSIIGEKGVEAGKKTGELGRRQEVHAKTERRG